MREAPIKTGLPQWGSHLNGFSFLNSQFSILNLKQ